MLNNSHTGIRENPGKDSLAISFKSQKRNLIGQNEPKIVRKWRNKIIMLVRWKDKQTHVYFFFSKEGKKQGQFQTDHFLSMMGERVVLMGSSLGTFINMK